MELNLFIAQVAVVFVPGIIWARLDVRYGSKTEPGEIEFFLRALVFGLSSYLAVFLVYALLGNNFDLVEFAEAETSTVLSSKVGDEIAWALLASFLMAIVWLYLVNHKILTRILQFLNVTNVYGDEDVWDYTLNASDPRVTYVNVRDFEKKLVYTGNVTTFSHTGKLRELVMSDVKLYDFDGNFLFAIPLLYLSRPQEDLHLEFPAW